MINRGIQTEQDRELFEYRPIIRYEIQQDENINEVIIPSDYDIDDNIKDVINRLPSNITRRIISSYNELENLIHDVEDMLTGISVFPDSSQQEAFLEAAEELGIDPNDGITYETYKDIMSDNNGEYAKQIIKDIWKEYHSDVNGSLAGEYYVYLLELEEDAKNFMDFWSKGVIQNIDYELGMNYSNPEAVLPQMEEQERVMIDNLILYKQAINDIKTNLRGFMVTMDPNDPINIAYDRLNSKYIVLEKEYTSLLRKSNVICEVGDVVSRKVNMEGYSVQLMKRQLKYTPQNAYNGKLVDVLEVLLKGCLKGDFLISLKQLRAITKYTIDNTNRQVSQNKDKSDAVFNNRIKKTIQDICVKDIGIKVGVCHPLLQMLNDVPNEVDDATSNIAGILLDGMQYAEDQYNNDITQLYGAYKSSAETYTKCVGNTYNKQIARDFYTILSVMIGNVENGGNYPNKSTLRRWIINTLSNATFDIGAIYDYSTESRVLLDL